MLARSAAWGVDLTGGAVRALHVERRGDEYRVVDAIVQPISPAGEGAEPLRAHLPETVGRGLTDLLRAHRASLTDPVFVAFPAIGSKQGRLEVPGRDPAQVRGLLDFELHHALKSDPQEWIVRMDEPRKQAQDTVAAEFHAHPRDAVHRFVADLRRFGVPVDGLVPGPVALARFGEVEWPIAPNRRMLLLEVQRTRTELVYAGERGPRFRSLPFGAGTLSDSSAPPPKEVERIAAQILREHQLAHKFLFGAHDGTALERIVLLGDAAHHNELRQALQEQFKVDVVSTPPRRFTADPRALGESSRHALHQGTALGLAVAALSREGERASLVPPPATRRAHRRLPALSAAMLIVALGLLATRFLADDEVARLDVELARMQEGIRWSASGEWESARDEARDAATEAQRLIARAAALRREIGFPSRLLDALRDPSVFYWLVAIDLTPAAGGDEATLTFETGNRSPSVDQRIKERLETHAGVEVKSLESTSVDAATVRVTVKVALREPEPAP